MAAPQKEMNVATEKLVVERQILKFMSAAERFNKSIGLLARESP